MAGAVVIAGLGVLIVGLLPGPLLDAAKGALRLLVGG